MGSKTGLQKFPFLAVVLLAVALAACSKLRPSRPLQSETQASVFVAPSLAPTITPTVKVEHSGPTQIPGCTNYLTYLSDLSVPDGTHFAGGTKMEKQWQVKNSGTCNWTDGYTIQLVGGEAMGARETQDLVPARGGAEAVVQIDFVAPRTPGEYNSSWQAFDPDGKPFGDKVFIQIIVNEP